MTEESKPKAEKQVENLELNKETTRIKIGNLLAKLGGWE